MGNQIEGGDGSDRNSAGDKGAGKLEQLNPERNASGAQVKEVQATNPDNFTSRTEMTALSEPLTVAEKKAARNFDSFGIDMGDGTVQTSKGVQQKGGTTVYERPAGQAVEPMPPPSPALDEAPYDSPVTLNVQITNVPEVSEGVKPEEALQHLNQVFEAGAEAVRPVKEWLATPNAVNDALAGIGPALNTAVNYYANTPADQVMRDAQTALEMAGDALDRTFAYPHTPEERAKTAGMIMPLFFFEGNAKEPISPQAAETMGLEGMSEAELTALGIRRAAQDAGDLMMPEVPEHLRHLEFQQITDDLVRAMETKGRTIHLAEPGSEAWINLEKGGCNAKVVYPWCNEIFAKQGGPRVALLEEFLHGTQQKLGLLGDPMLPKQLPEIHVKDFMLRHAKMLGLDENDAILLRELKRQAIQRMEKDGYRWTGK